MQLYGKSKGQEWSTESSSWSARERGWPSMGSRLNFSKRLLIVSWSQAVIPSLAAPKLHYRLIHFTHARRQDKKKKNLNLTNVRSLCRYSEACKERRRVEVLPAEGYDRWPQLHRGLSITIPKHDRLFSSLEHSSNPLFGPIETKPPVCCRSLQHGRRTCCNLSYYWSSE
jgi:hypothetical protein